nr:sigma-70 family RNA polymerase sigma factor [Virgibacillus profundi]
MFKQNERRIYYHIHKLRIDDPHQEFYQEGLYAMWNAYKTYQTDKGILSTYFNYIIRNRLIDLYRNKTKQKQHEIFTKSELEALDIHIEKVKEPFLWKMLQSELTENQWKWVNYRIRLEMSVKEIAEVEHVSIDTVKYWGRQVRQRLRNERYRKLLLDRRII